MKYIKERKKICNGCEFKKQVMEGMLSFDVCGKLFVKDSNTCGCVINFKITVPTEKCPQGKWDAII